MTMDKLLGNTMNAQTRTECCCGVFISKDFTCVAPIHTVQHLKSLFNSPLSNFRFSFTHPQQDFFGASPSSFFLYNGQTTSMSVSSLYCTPFLHCTFAIIALLPYTYLNIIAQHFVKLVRLPPSQSVPKSLPYTVLYNKTGQPTSVT